MKKRLELLRQVVIRTHDIGQKTVAAQHQGVGAHGGRHLFDFSCDAHHVLRVLLVQVVSGEDILLLLLRLTMAWRVYHVKT